MSVEWSIKYGEVEKTLAEWGVKNLSRRERIEAVEDVTFFRPCKRMEVDLLFPADAVLQFYRMENGVKVKWFEGLVVDPDRKMNAQEEGQGYVVAGPWYYLEHHIFKQIWKSYTGDPNNLADVRVSRVHLGTKVVIDQLQRQHMRDQIKEILDYAILCGAPIQYDVSGIPAIFLPTDELLDRYCSEALVPQLRVVPDLVVRWDYTATPPKLIFKKRDDIVPVNISALDGLVVDELEIKECFDLRRPSVVIRYEVTNTDNGFEWTQHATDKMPENATGDELRAFMKTVNLQGFSRTTSNAWLQSVEIQPNNVAWWQAHVNWLNDDEIEQITLGVANRSGTLGLPYELTDGTFPPWLVEQDYSYELETVWVPVTVKFKNGTVREDVISVDVNATDAETGDYTNEDSFAYPEPIPVGLAQELWNAFNRREFKGTLKLVQQECTGLLKAGFTFNITDGRAEWQTMNALVNEVEEDIDNGTTNVRFGPPPYLGLDEAMELLRVNRARWVTTSTTRRATGKAGIDSRIDMPRTTAKKNTATGTKNHQIFSVRTSTSDKDKGSILLDASKTVVGGTLREIEIREMKVCVTNPDGTTTTKKVLGPFSELY